MARLLLLASGTALQKKWAQQSSPIRRATRFVILLLNERLPTPSFTAMRQRSTSSYRTMKQLRTVLESMCWGMAHTNGMESFWSMLKRAHMGTFHKLSPKHLNRYVQEFACKHNMRDSGTLAQMRDTAALLIGRNLLYRDLIADNGLPSGRSNALANVSGVAPRRWVFGSSTALMVALLTP